MTQQTHFSGKSIARAFWLSSIIALAACSHQAVKTRPTMIQPISNNAQFDDVIALLVDGDVEPARKKLAAMAQRDPADRQTGALIASLDADPQVALGTKSFAYRVQPGDRMTALSQRFLGDRLKFYLLSRYNKIIAPGKIVPGQILRVPGIAPPVVVAPHIAPEPVRAPVASVQPKPVPKSPVAAPVTSATALHRAAQLRGAGLAALNAGNIGRSVTLLRQAAALDHNSPAIRTDLARALRIQATVAARR